MSEREQLLRVRELANEIIRLRLQDSAEFSELELKNNVELLARSVIDLVNIQLLEDADSSTSLKATVCKMKMAYNQMEKVKKNEPLYS
ncbi:hypothetical protein [Metabacillus iocasae]|uniref:Uncharacterized protein n=1 Tax=Priestia iocasae TaxID=2291674 RepID=A0ABS2QYZ3_9BACI|nr:hypothetical protein [Metabacillus iocasae]MBM7704714.1 hypothetical protein [Metabacillus iocasae]